MTQETINIITAIANIATALGLLVTIWTFRNGIKRERKRETVNFHSSIGEKCGSFLSAITREFGDSVIINYNEAKANDKVFNAIMGYLAAMEEFSVGINNKVFDLNLFKETAGPRSVIWYSRFEEIILVIRKEKKRKSIFQEFENMVDKIDPNRKKLEIPEQELQEKIDRQKRLDEQKKQEEQKKREEKDEQKLQKHLQNLEHQKKEPFDVKLNEIQIDISAGKVKSEQAESEHTDKEQELSNNVENKKAEPIKYTAEEQKSIDALSLEGINYLYTN